MRRSGRRWSRVAWGLSGLGVLAFGTLLVSLLVQAWPDLTWRFLATWPNEATGQGGIFPELLNTGVMVGVTLLVTVPLGLGVAIYQHEFRGRSHPGIARLGSTWLSAPTIVIALVVYRLVVGWWHWPVSLATGVVALTIINWPFMVAIAEGALAGVPVRYRLASRALGASRWQTVVRVVMPAALAPIIEGVGMAAARLAGESAALIVTAGVNVSRHWGFWAPGETLAVHIWYIRTEGFHAHRDAAAAATGVVLLLVITVVLWISRRAAKWFEQGRG